MLTVNMFNKDKEPSCMQYSSLVANFFSQYLLVHICNCKFDIFLILVLMTPFAMAGDRSWSVFDKLFLDTATLIYECGSVEEGFVESSL